MRKYGFSFLFERTLKSETFRIVSDLTLKNLVTAKDGLQGHMKIIRASDKACGNRLYATLALARKIGSKETDLFFEVLRYFDNLQITEYRTSRPLTRIWQTLQRHRCDGFKDFKALEKCDCKKYQPTSDAVACSACGH